jgi:hypothetical protein
LNTSTFRKADNSLNSAAAVRMRRVVAGAAIGALAITSFPAAAQQVNQPVNATVSPACEQVVRDTAGFKQEVQCEIDKLRADTEASKRRTEAMLAINECVKYLTKGVQSGTILKDDIYSRAGGKDQFRQGDTACVVARHFGFGRKAELPLN